MSMRNGVGVVCYVLLLTVTAAAQKITEQIECGKPDQQHAIPVDDAPGHVYSISHTRCTYPKPANIGAAKKVAGEDVIFSETSGSRVRWYGVYSEAMSNGDKLYYRHKGAGVLQDGAFTSGEDAWEVSGGTGSYKGYKGNGICKLQPQADGTFLNKCRGEYTPPK
ncbi:MAG: hypothetical protein LAO06_00830 [Acidobacteriia bacterium]|nr:hypothetical protein [Terriglobia bacterium]